MFICTADPEKKPTVGVMNMVLSAMAMDYPPEKLHVYLSDDAGAGVILNGMREAGRFAKWWLPFCKRCGIECTASEAYFSAAEDDGDEDGGFGGNEFVQEKEHMKKRPVMMRMQLKQMKRKNVPLLIYVSCEKRPSQPHHFKVGVLNVLLRVSGVVSNSPYILGLDCDMHCHDANSARQTLCFHLDPKISPSLAFIKFPQNFHNISNNNDIYDSQLRSALKVLWKGYDGLGGPCVSGTGYYIKRVSLCESSISEAGDAMKLRQCYGPSNEFIKSLRQINKPDHILDFIYIAKVGFQYIVIQKGHNSWAVAPPIWMSFWSKRQDGPLAWLMLLSPSLVLLYMALSKRPLFFTACVMQNLPFSQFSISCRSGALLPFLNSAYPQGNVHLLYVLKIETEPFTMVDHEHMCGKKFKLTVSNTYFIVFSFIFLSSHSKHLYEVLATGSTFRHWVNEQRIWMMKLVTSHLYGSVDAFMKKLGMRAAGFFPTNKVDDVEQLKHYNMGVFDFQTSLLFLAPMVALVILNMASFAVGIARGIFVGE
ncbi:hypothetical protein ACFX19_022632 [Malus domestica]